MTGQTGKTPASSTKAHDILLLISAEGRGSSAQTFGQTFLRLCV